MNKKKDEILDDLENMNAQILNGGFYFYYINRIEYDQSEAQTALLACLVGTMHQFPGYKEVGQLLASFLKRVDRYKKLPKTFDQDELEHREEILVQDLEPMDDEYYKWDEVISPRFEEVAELMEAEENKIEESKK